MTKLCVSRLLKVVAAGGMVVALLLVVGPTEPIHHQLHIWDVQPYFVACCCANAAHTVCAWSDHFGKWWPLHHPGFAKLGGLIGAISFIALAGILIWERSR